MRWGGEVVLTLCEICTNGNEYKRVIFPSQEGCNKNNYVYNDSYVFQNLRIKMSFIGKPGHFFHILLGIQNGSNECSLFD